MVFRIDKVYLSLIIKVNVFILIVVLFSSRDPVTEWVGVSLGMVGNSGRFQLDAPLELANFDLDFFLLLKFAKL